MNTDYKASFKTFEDKFSIQDNNRVIIVDMDETLINISYLWYKEIRKNWDVFKDYFKDLGDLNEIQVLGRKEYYLNKWLKKDEIDELPEEIMVKFFECYNNINYYDIDNFNKLNPIADGIIQMAKQTFVEKIYILSKTTTIDVANYKKELFAKHFKTPNNKIEMLLVPNDCKKSDIINDNKIKYTTFIDDNPNDLEDVIMNTTIYGKEFIYPILGYNDRIVKNSDIMERISKNFASIKGYRNISPNYTYTLD